MKPWYSTQFGADILRWRDEDPTIGARVVRLVEQTLADPRQGIGWPKRLTGIPHVWSRRITRSHRLFYELAEDGYIDFLQCYGHDLPQEVIDERRDGAA